MEHIGRQLEVKSIGDSGSFEGLASVYGNVDLGGDIVEAGAFKEFAYTKDNMIRILDGHNTRAPIGKGSVIDTHVGLAIKGQLNLKVSRARDVYELMKDGIIDGLSIGFDILKGGYEIREDGIRLIKQVKLWEISTTSFPMNQAATISGVKEIQRVNRIREVEDLLREAVGLSRTQAKLHASGIWKTLSGRRDADGEVGEETTKLIQTLQQFSKQ